MRLKNKFQKIINKLSYRKIPYRIKKYKMNKIINDLYNGKSVNKQKMYKLIEDIENELERTYQTNNLYPISYFRQYRIFYFITCEHQRFFDILIRYKFYENLNTQSYFFEVCRPFGQTAMYYRYMTNYFPKIIYNLILQKASYELWGHHISTWLHINHSSSEEKHSGDNYNIIALHFIATISILKNQQEKKYLLDDIYNHPEYSKAILFYERFLKTKDMTDINNINNICFEHIKKVRKLDNFDDDPWISFYNDLQNSQEYKKFVVPYYQYMDNNNIDYQDKLIFCLPYDKNVGDNYLFVNAIIDWSLQNKIPLIALLTSFQMSWIGIYFKDYFDYIIIRNSNVKVPYILNLLYPTANRLVAINQPYEDIPPYYLPRTTKRHFNHYTHNELYKSDIDMGNPVPISSIPHDIKKINQQLLKQKALDPRKIILLSPNSKSTNFFSGSNIILKEFWDQLVLKLKKAGFTPLVNLSLEHEKHCISDAESLNLPLSHIIDFVDNIGGFIGVRSGLCDLLCSSNNSKKYCIYPIEYVDWCNDLALWYNIVHFKFDNIDRHVNDIMNSLLGEKIGIFEHQKCYGYLSVRDYNNYD